MIIWLLDGIIAHVSNKHFWACSYNRHKVNWQTRGSDVLFCLFLRLLLFASSMLIHCDINFGIDGLKFHGENCVLLHTLINTTTLGLPSDAALGSGLCARSQHLNPFCLALRKVHSIPLRSKANHFPCHDSCWSGTNIPEWHPGRVLSFVYAQLEHCAPVELLHGADQRHSHCSSCSLWARARRKR